jgi:RNA ligase (TIGR02306 family)
MKIATIENIHSITKHPNADSLALAKVLGYQVIIGLDSFKEGDKVVFIQPDTLLPEEPWAEMFRKRSSRVKACKLRGEWSFGIALPLSTWADKVDILSGLDIGVEIGDFLGITKWEPPMPQDLSAAGVLPRGIPKTDEERWQNLELPYGSIVDVSLKIDGKSMTVYSIRSDDGWKTGVTSRSMDLKLDCSNHYTRMEKAHDLISIAEDLSKRFGIAIALRGEVYGHGIQAHGKNPHSQENLNFALYNVFSADSGKNFGPESELYFERVAKMYNISHVPILERSVVLTPELVRKYSEELKTVNNKPFEGVVIKQQGGESFKIINLHYDEKK